VGWLCSLIIIIFCWYQTGSFALCLAVAFAAAPGYYSLMVFDYLLIDYHFLNAFFIQLWLVLAAIFCSSRQSWILISSGIVTALFITTWQAAPLFYLFASLYGLFLIFTNSKLSNSYNEYISNSLVIGSILAAIFVLPKKEFRFGIEGFNYFHVTTILIAGLFFKFVDYLSFKKKLGFKKVAVLIILLAVVIIFFMWGIFGNQIIYGVSFLTANEPLMSTISELRSAFTPSQIFLKPLDIFKSFLYTGFGFLLLPLIYILNPKKIFNSGGKIILDWFLIISLLSLYSVRFVRWFGGFPAFFNGCAVYLIVNYVLNKIKLRKSEQTAWKPFKITVVSIPYILIVFFLTFAVFFNSNRKISKTKIESLNWIKKHTPDTSGYKDSEKPEYGILCYWDEGNAISYYARRPVLVGNDMRGYKKMAEIFSAQTEDEAIKYCEKYDAKYIYIQDRNLNDKTIDMMHIYKNLPDGSVDSFSHAYGKEARKNKNHLYIDSFHHWLSRQAAIKPSGKFLQPTSHFRIVFSSEQANRFVPPEILIYEVVQGCEILGRADPFSEVVLSLECKFDKVEQLYKRKVQADADGTFSIKVPYSNSYYSGRIKTSDYYKVAFKRDGDLIKARLDITDEDVLNGEAIELVR
jgi:dolichyl-diphosphooligosaccharide--protein glycosyltransferase